MVQDQVVGSRMYEASSQCKCLKFDVRTKSATLNMIIGGSISPFAVQESTAVRSPFSAPVVLTCTAFLPLTSTVRPGTISKEDWQSVVNVSSVPN